MKRREFVTGGVALSALGLAGCQTTYQSFSSVPSLGLGINEKHRLEPVNMNVIPREFHRQRVNYETKYKPGTIVVDTSSRHLFFVEEDGTAVRYGIGVGRQGFSWKGTARIGRKAKWPTWTPPPAMIRREPHLQEWATGMPGGPRNPLGARALYLYQGRRDTLYRLHGTNQPRSIGQAMSSGCVRMLNQDAVDLYERASVGARVVVG
ncbi:MAG: L,D-transpeptidase [Pseudomonadota bacterium]